MKIANLLKKENILHISHAENKWKLIQSLVVKLIGSYENENFSSELADSLLDGVLKRENQSSTSLGQGIAFPHGRVNGLNKPLIALAIIKDGMDFDSPDDMPTKLVFLFLFPGNRYDLGVKIQAVFARFLSENNNIEKLVNSSDADEVYRIIEDASLIVDTPIVAQDLMKGVKIKFTQDMLLHDATSNMKKYNTEVAPIVDENNNIIGEIDCIHLFQIELPDYIKKMHSVPKIHDFNPFSKYFENNASITLKEVMNKNIATVSLDASLLEIIFLLAVKKHFVVHVCEKGKLVGFIDRITVLDKVFNL